MVIKYVKREFNKKTAPLFLLIMAMNFNAKSQIYSIGENSTVSPKLIAEDNFSIIKLSRAEIDGEKTNRFNIQNPYTYIQSINDDRKRVYQVLYQTNFTGRVLYLAVSKNLSDLINNKERGVLAFHSCVNGINEEFTSLKNQEVAINCILQQLNHRIYR